MIGEALGTLAGPALPWVLGDPAGPLAGDSFKNPNHTNQRRISKDSLHNASLTPHNFSAFLLAL